MNKQGLILCAKYAIAPNFFGYCGPVKTQSLIDHLKEEASDNELKNILSDFETLYPYLQFIAWKNKILDPFDRRVVEAYWIGNKLLKPLTLFEYQAFAQEKLFLDKKLSKEELANLKLKIDNVRFLPHHNFHVFNIFKRTGHVVSFHTLQTMDECRISWGKIIKTQNSKLKAQSYLVETQKLAEINHRLKLNKQIFKTVKLDYRGKSFIKNLKVGDWISFHWGFVCDVLTKKQVKNLEFYTKQAINFFNTNF